MPGLSTDIDEIRAIGHGALSLVNVAILVAIIAVVVSGGAQTASVIQQALAFMAWLVAQVVKPVSGGDGVTLSATLAPADALSSGGTDAANAAGAGAGTGAGGGWDNAIFPGPGALDAGGWDQPFAAGGGGNAGTGGNYAIPTITVRP